jgi:hypothetical protein
MKGTLCLQFREEDQFSPERFFLYEDPFLCFHTTKQIFPDLLPQNIKLEWTDHNPKKKGWKTISILSECWFTLKTKEGAHAGYPRMDSYISRQLKKGAKKKIWVKITNIGLTPKGK